MSAQTTGTYKHLPSKTCAWCISIEHLSECCRRSSRLPHWVQVFLRQGRFRDGGGHLRVKIGRSTIPCQKSDWLIHTKKPYRVWLLSQPAFQKDYQQIA